MGELVHFEVRELPKLYVVGKSRTYNAQEHRKQNRIPEFWKECSAEDTMKPLWEQTNFLYDNAMVGWMADWQNQEGTFVYMIGVLMSEGFRLPDDSYAAREIGPINCGVGWIQGANTPDVCMPAHELTVKAIGGSGPVFNPDIPWCMEYYHHKRFNEPDKDGRIILDYYLPLV